MLHWGGVEKGSALAGGDKMGPPQAGRGTQWDLRSPRAREGDVMGPLGEHDGTSGGT